MTDDRACERFMASARASLGKEIARAVGPAERLEAFRYDTELMEEGSLQPVLDWGPHLLCRHPDSG